MAKLQTAFQKSDNPIAPNIYITSDGQIMGQPSISTEDEKNFAENEYAKYFFFYDKTRDLMTFNSFFSTKSSPVGVAEKVIFKSGFYKDDRQVVRTLENCKQAYKVELINDKIHINGATITFDKCPEFLPITSYFEMEKTGRTFSDYIPEAYNGITCKKVINKAGQKSFDITTIEGDYLRYLKAGYNILAHEYQDYFENEAMVFCFKLEGRKIIKIEAPKNSCNLYIANYLSGAAPKLDAGNLVIDFDMQEATTISETLTETSSASKDASAHASAAIAQEAEESKEDEGSIVKHVRVAAGQHTGSSIVYPLFEDYNLDIKPLGDTPSAE